MMKRASGGGRKKATVTVLKKSPVQMPPPDELLSEEARELWAQQYRYLQENHLLGAEHIGLLILHCNAWHYVLMADKAILQLASDDPKSRGLTCKSADESEKLNPVINVRNIHINQFIRTSSLLGLDPLSSTRIQANKGTSQHNPFLELNEFDKF